MTKQQIKNAYLMTEELNKHKAEEDVYRELDEQKDNNYIMQVVSRRGGYSTSYAY